MIDRPDDSVRDEIAALLGMRDIPPLVERRRRPVHVDVARRRAGAETRYCVLIVVLEDTDQALKRLRPIVAGVRGIAYDLSAADAIKRASDVAAHA
jgi:hypothetical protein